MGGAGNHRSRAHARSPDSRGYRKLRPQEFHAASASIIGDTLVRAGRPSKRVVEGKAGAGGGGHAELSASHALVRPRRMPPASREWGDRRDRDPFAPAGRPTPDWAVVHRELKKPGVTRILLWQEYLAQHPGGYRYTQFTQLYKAWAAGAPEPRMRRVHQPGAMIEVDYAGMTLPIRIGNTIRAAAVFVACLPYSGYLFAEATWTQAAEDWLASHVRLFAHLGGVPGKLVPDNLKTGITHASFFDPVVNRDYLDLAQHYTVAVVPTRTRRPRDKASVENGVLQVERRVLAPLRHRTFGSLEEANRAIAAQLALVNAEPLSANPAVSRLSLFRDEEQAALRPLPPEPFVIGRWSRLKVPPDYHVGVEGVAYSVPSRLIGQRVDIHRTPTLVSIFHDGVRVAAHPRQQASGRGTVITLDEHRPLHHRAASCLTPRPPPTSTHALGTANGHVGGRDFQRADA